MEERNWEKVFENINSNSCPLLLEEGANTMDLIEEFLMKDDDDIDNHNFDDLIWLDDLILDSPPLHLHPSPSSSPPVSSSNSEAQAQAQAQGIVVNGNTSSNSDNDKSCEDDPLSKKRKRQLRNRDAAMRSRERKKIYVKDLESKSRYLEAECRRLGRLLQCCYAENQMLRISLGSAYGASMAKPESAVLLLESLLLVSLVWSMVNICLPKLPLLNQGAVPHASVVERKEKESVAPNKEGMEVTELWVTLSFLKSKRCRASRIKMKSNFECAVPCF